MNERQIMSERTRWTGDPDERALAIVERIEEEIRRKSHGQVPVGHIFSQLYPQLLLEFAGEPMPLSED